LEPSNINRRLHRFLDACTLPRQGMHSLRHCCASLMLAQGIPARIVMEQLGHSQISLTMDTYAHVMPTMLKEAAKSVSAALSEAASGTD
jgi:integrase